MPALSKEPTHKCNIKIYVRASPVAQWLRIRLPMQGTWVRALAREDPTCRGTAEPVRHNYWSPRTWSPCSATREATAMRSPLTAKKSGPHSPQLEKARVQQRKPNAAKNKLIKWINLKKKKKKIYVMFKVPGKMYGIQRIRLSSWSLWSSWVSIR